YQKVSLEKREKILAIAHDLHYRPNPAALSLARKETRTIGLLTSPFLSNIYSDLVSKISFVLREKNYNCSIQLPVNAEQEVEAIRHLESFGADGIIVAYAINDVRQLRSEVPMVSMSPHPGQYEVRVDLKYATALAVDHLRSHGHQKIGMICPQLSVVPQQWDGYLDAVGAENAFRLEVVSNPRFNAEFAYLLQEMHVRAWVVTNDFLAARVMHYVLAQGYRVPDDVALIGFDGAALAEITPTPLSTVVFPAAKVASACVDLLLKKIANQDMALCEPPCLITPELHLGGSCGCTPTPPTTVRWAGQPLTFDNVDGENVCISH
ncbi:MAG TPA: LacI family DNA-binding transcriptional regulator, partial [Armatimonadota bacterium]|nr:LacI family DNA-binding transcriptional regulator [Armatimonadota bacterium]